jgi:hypothetical protein
MIDYLLTIYYDNLSVTIYLSSEKGGVEGGESVE